MGSTKISQPSPPPQPTVQDSASSYAQSLPTMYDAQLKYSPMFEQQNLDMTQQFAPQYKAIQDALYPELAALDKSLVNQAAAGTTAGLTDAQKNMYLDQFRAEVGDNNGSGIGADYVSRSLLNTSIQQQQYYQNMGLTLTGRQPLYQSNPGGYSQSYQPIQGYNYGATSGFQGQGYGNYSNAYSSMYSANGAMKLGMNQIYQGYAQMGMKAGGAMMGMPPM